MSPEPDPPDADVDADAHADAPRRDRRVRHWLGPTLFIVLLVASLVATAFMIRVKTPDLMLEVIDMKPRKFTPDGDGRRDRIEITVFVRESEPAALVEVISTQKDMPVRTLSEAVALDANQPVTFIWNGLRNNGRPAALGGYRLRVTMPSLGREIEFPRRFFVEANGVNEVPQ